MQLRSLALRTDQCFDRLRGEVLERDGYMCVRTPENPHFWYGNSLTFPTPPGPGDLERWMELFAQEFPDTPSNHRVFQWDSPEGERGAVEPFLEAGFELNTGEVLTARALQPLANPNSEIEVRPLNGANDDEQRFELARECARRDDARDSDTHAEFLLRQIELSNRMVHAGHGTWWGAFAGEQLVCDLGLFFFDNIGRFQDVKTHPDFRRRGICRTVIASVSLAALTMKAAHTLVIVAEAEGPASKLYRAVGFRPTEFSMDVSRAPTA